MVLIHMTRITNWQISATQIRDTRQPAALVPIARRAAETTIPHEMKRKLPSAPKQSHADMTISPVPQADHARLNTKRLGCTTDCDIHVSFTR